MIVKNPFVVLDKKNKKLIPQPTRFWIIDPQLKKRISRLEEKGYIKLWEDRVSQDKELFEFFVSLHKKEILLRKVFLMDKNYPDYIVKKLLSTGIGGIQDYDKLPFKVKCLHLWTAYHLGDFHFENPIGRFVLKKI